MSVPVDRTKIRVQTIVDRQLDLLLEKTKNGGVLQDEEVLRLKTLTEVVILLDRRIAPGRARPKPGDRTSEAKLLEYASK